jgi:hypothetical protein
MLAIFSQIVDPDHGADRLSQVAFVLRELVSLTAQDKLK